MIFSRLVFHRLPPLEFRPRKKIFSPPPPKIPNLPQTPSRPLGPSPPGETPPLVGFSIKNRPPPSRRPRTPPSPSPSRKKNKKYPKRPPRKKGGERGKKARAKLVGLSFVEDALFFPNFLSKNRRKGQRTRKIKGSRSHQRSVMEHSETIVLGSSCIGRREKTPTPRQESASGLY